MMEESSYYKKPDLSLGNLHFHKEEKEKIVEKYIQKGMTLEQAEKQVKEDEKEAYNKRARAISESERRGN